MVQLPGSNCFHLLTPAPRPGGSLAPGFQLQSGGPQEEPRSRRGRERPAFLCQRSSREVGRRGRNPRPADPKCPGQVAAIVVQLLATAHPFHGCPPGVRREPPEEDRQGSRKSCVTVRPLTIAIATFIVGGWMNYCTKNDISIPLKAYIVNVC